VSRARTLIANTSHNESDVELWLPLLAENETLLWTGRNNRFLSALSTATAIPVGVFFAWFFGRNILTSQTLADICGTGVTAFKCEMAHFISWPLFLFGLVFSLWGFAVLLANATGFFSFRYAVSNQRVFRMKFLRNSRRGCVFANLSEAAPHFKFYSSIGFGPKNRPLVVFGGLPLAKAREVIYWANAGGNQ
jgi:hypothetical protein